MSRILGGGLALCLVAPPSAASTSATYSVDSGHSALQISVGKSGLFKAFGHDHLIRATRLSGLVRFDEHELDHASVNFVVDTASLRAIDLGESDANRQQVQLTMLSDKVLDVERFPEISFTSAAVSMAVRTAAGWDLDLTGVLKLHGVERSMRVLVHLQADRGVLRVRGDVKLRQSDFGITLVTAAGGMVTVKDEVTISFEIVAAKAPGADAVTVCSTRETESLRGVPTVLS